MGTGMRTFSGTIISSNEIRLENSLIIKHDIKKTFKLGSKVLISFDMCKNRVRHIWSREEITPHDTEPEPEPGPTNRSFDPEEDDEHNRLITILESMEGLSQTEL